jgi:hypothetical protein
MGGSGQVGRQAVEEGRVARGGEHPAGDGIGTGGRR